MQMDVSRPPEYANTTVSLEGSACAELAITADEALVQALVEVFVEVVIVTSFLDDGVQFAWCNAVCGAVQLAWCNAACVVQCSLCGAAIVQWSEDARDMRT